MINSGTENVRWDLSFLYSGIDDPKIDVDIAELVKKVVDFNIHYKSKLAGNLGEAIVDYTEIKMLRNKVCVYLSLRQSTDTGDAFVKAKIAEAERILTQADGEYLTFFYLELVALEDTALEQLYKNDPVVLKHRPWIEYIRLFKPHVLSEQVESALTKRSPFGSEAWSEFFNELEANLRFSFRGEEKTLTEVLHVLGESKDPEERAQAMQLIDEGLRGPFAKYSAQTLYMVTGLNAVERKERGYQHPMERRNKSNRIADPVVETLHRAVEYTAVPLAKKYYGIKAAHLSVKTLKWSDRNAPLPFTDTTSIKFSEAIATVLAAYESFSPTLAKLIHEMVKSRRIDALAAKGKRGGAFCSSVMLPCNQPVSFVFLNYLGSNRDVMTLAHELGHGGHGILAGETQGALMCNAPIAYCETASVFGEMTTFNFLKNRLAAEGNDQALLALLMNKIEDILNTSVRQIGFSNFERRLHGMDSSSHEWKESRKLSVEEINMLWLDSLKQFYGENGEIFTYENVEHLWTYVHHFHYPFYVYGYAFGELLTQSLYAQRPRLGERFEPLYLDLLRSGATKNVNELLEPFGLDPTNEQFWADGIKISLGVMVEEAEQLSCAMGVSA